MESTPSDLVAYTDGACSGNPGPGGWAAVLVRGGSYYEEIGGREERTTNNRMEMRAAIEALRMAQIGDRVHVVTDSRYLHDGILKWIHGWRRNGWKKADGNDVLNRDLWLELDDLARRPGRRVTWEHVRGHAGHAMNERCDAIATAFARGGSPELQAGDGNWIPGLGSSDGRSGDYPLYLSLVDGQLETHGTWAECEARVRGAKGARHRKARSEGERQAVLADWGVSLD